MTRFEAARRRWREGLKARVEIVENLLSGPPVEDTPTPPTKGDADEESEPSEDSCGRAVAEQPE